MRAADDAKQLGDLIGRLSPLIFADALAKILARVKIEIVKRSDHTKGFVTLPKRWIVERTIAWLNLCRRLAKDWENLNFTALIFPPTFYMHVSGTGDAEQLARMTQSRP